MGLNENTHYYLRLREKEKEVQLAVCSFHFL